MTKTEARFRIFFLEHSVIVSNFELRISDFSQMNNIELDDRGLVLACPHCGKRNRLKSRRTRADVPLRSV